MPVIATRVASSAVSSVASPPVPGRLAKAPTAETCTPGEHDWISFAVTVGAEGDPVSVTECAGCGEIIDYTG
jgi:hypothetical protein